MPTPLSQKSSVAEIRTRFDGDVERFSRLEVGQQALPDTVLAQELVARAAASRLTPGGRLLDVGCGAGNFSLRVLEHVRDVHCTLSDLSQPMLARAAERLSAAGAASVTPLHGDMRFLPLPPESQDVIIAGSVLHHLREDADWHAMFARLHTWLRPGGWLLVSDLVTFDDPALQAAAWERYAHYLEALKGPHYRDEVFGYIDKEDSPRSVAWQFRALRGAGFVEMDVLHRNGVLAAYVAMKAA